MTKKILVIDLESTGFLNQGGSIVEVGLVSLSLDTGEIKTLIDSTCREKILSAKHREEPFGWIFKNSTLTVEEVRRAQPFDFLKQDLQKLINQHPLGLTAYNRNFDVGFLESRGVQFKKLLSCPMLLLTPIIKLPHKNGRKGNKWPSFEESWEYFYPKSKYKEDHRAGQDARDEAKILYEMYKKGIFKVD